MHNDVSCGGDGFMSSCVPGTVYVYVATVSSNLETSDRAEDDRPTYVYVFRDCAVIHTCVQLD
jgi:hypothetical protein